MSGENLRFLPEWVRCGMESAELVRKHYPEDRGAVLMFRPPLDRETFMHITPIGRRRLPDSLRGANDNGT